MANNDDMLDTLSFSTLFCKLLDKHRENLGFYLANDAVLDWFGRTIIGREHIVWFFTHTVPNTVHKLSSVEPSDPFQHRKGNLSPSSSDDGCNDDDLGVHMLDGNPPFSFVTPQKPVNNHNKLDSVGKLDFDKLSVLDDSDSEMNDQRIRNVPLRVESGQGDCGPREFFYNKTSRISYLEARGSVEFCHKKQQSGDPKNLKLISGTMKSDRQCKLQIAYTWKENSMEGCGDGLNRRYKVKLIIYQGTSSCRRNLAKSFDKVL